MEEIFTYHLSNGGLLQRIHREPLKINSTDKKKKTSVPKWAKDLSSHFSKYIYIYIQMPIKHIEDVQHL
jgi:hypothetical protein